MNTYLKVLLIYFMRFILKIFYIFSVIPKRIVFNSYGGKDITCNPKYVFLQMQEEYGTQYEYIWCIKNKERRNSYEKQFSIKTIPPSGFRFFYYTLTSQIYIGNGIAPSYLPFRKAQCIIGTWHGGGAYKKGGIDITNSKLSRLNYQLSAEHASYVISSCRSFSKVLREAFLVESKKILEIGTPRNDVFFKTDKQLEEAIRQKLHISSADKIVLYAPTFRSKLNDLESDFSQIPMDFDVEKLCNTLTEKFAGNWTILYRSHYHCSSNAPAKKLVIDVSEYPDMQELLLVADVLITDYSSSIWDYSFTKRPCFITAPDIYDYEQTRGFYTPISRWPFSIAQNSSELYSNIKNFDEQQYRERIEQHHLELGSFENGTASKLVANLISKYCSCNILA